VQGEDSNHVVRFGVFEVDLRSGELRKYGSKVKLQDQPFQVLAMLLERPGEVVTREELRVRIWPSGVFVDYDRSLNRAINKLREALGDSPENPRFIETLARRGYRFLVPVESIKSVKSTALPLSAPPGGSKHVLSLRGRLRWVFWSTLATLAAAILVGVRVWVSGKQSGQPGLIAVPLTTYPGHQMFPDFSPDGNQLVFDWAGPKNDNVDVYVKLNGTENLLRLTQDPAPDYAPAWSPDGRYVAFLRDFLNGQL